MARYHRLTNGLSAGARGVRRSALFGRTSSRIAIAALQCETIFTRRVRRPSSVNSAVCANGPTGTGDVVRFSLRRGEAGDVAVQHRSALQWTIEVSGFANRPRQVTEHLQVARGVGNAVRGPRRALLHVESLGFGLTEQDDKGSQVLHDGGDLRAGQRTDDLQRRVDGVRHVGVSRLDPRGQQIDTRFERRATGSGDLQRKQEQRDHAPSIAPSMQGPAMSGSAWLAGCLRIRGSERHRGGFQLRRTVMGIVTSVMSAATVGVGSVVSLGSKPPPDMRFATGDNTVASFVGRMETEAAPLDTTATVRPAASNRSVACLNPVRSLRVFWKSMCSSSTTIATDLGAVRSWPIVGDVNSDTSAARTIATRYLRRVMRTMP